MAKINANIFTTANIIALVKGKALRLNGETYNPREEGLKLCPEGQILLDPTGEPFIAYHGDIYGILQNIWRFAQKDRIVVKTRNLYRRTLEVWCNKDGWPNSYSFTLTLNGERERYWWWRPVKESALDSFFEGDLVQYHRYFKGFEEGEDFSGPYDINIEELLRKLQNLSVFEWTPQIEEAVREAERLEGQPLRDFWIDNYGTIGAVTDDGCSGIIITQIPDWDGGFHKI